MALIQCSHCGSEISDRASVCPHCGMQPHEPSSSERTEERNGIAATSVVVSHMSGLNGLSVASLVCLGLAVVFALMAGAFYTQTIILASIAALLMFASLYLLLFSILYVLSRGL